LSTVFLGMGHGAWGMGQTGHGHGASAKQGMGMGHRPNRAWGIGTKNQEPITKNQESITND
jgi:hypothetical protein